MISLNLSLPLAAFPKKRRRKLSKRLISEIVENEVNWKTEGVNESEAIVTPDPRRSTNPPSFHT